jgi:hypothetical protein
MESGMERSRSRSSKSRRKRGARRSLQIPAESVALGEYLMRLHKTGCPTVFLKIIYYLSHIVGFVSDLVDSVEVFSGTANYSKALQSMAGFAIVNLMFLQQCFCSCVLFCNAARSRNIRRKVQAGSRITPMCLNLK